MTHIVAFFNLEIKMENLDNAAAIFRLACDEFEAKGNRRGVAICQNNLANILHMQERHDESKDLYVAAIEAGRLVEAEEIGNGAPATVLTGIRLQIADRQLNYAKLLLSIDHDQDALKLLSEGIKDLGKIKGGPQLEVFEKGLMMSVLRLQCYSGLAKIK